MKRISEDHKEISSGKKKDDEGYMARNELDTIERQIKNLRKVIKSSDTQLPAWVQSKITKAADYIDTAAEYLQSDEGVDEGVSFTVDPKKLRKDARAAKIRNLAQKGSTEGERQAAERKTSGPKLFGENISLVEKILGEEKCGKGMYWCNTDKVCKPLPSGFDVPGQNKKPTEVGIGKKVASEGKSCNHTKKGSSCPVHGMNDCSMKEERDPKGPTQPYKSPEEIAKKHGVSLEAIKKQLEMGIKVEGEHTSNKTAARITALQHLDEVPDYYSKLKKVEKKSTKNESVTIEDMFGNTFVEFVDLIKPQDIIDEKKIPVTRQAGDFRYPGKTGEEKATNKAKRLSQSQNPDDRKRANKINKTIKTVADRDTARASSDARQGLYRSQQRRANDLAKQLMQKEEIEEAVRIPSQNGQLMMIIFTWRGRPYSLKMFFPQIKMPSRSDVEFELQKVYPGAKVLQSHVTDLKQDGKPVLQIQNSPSKNYLLNNGTIGEDWQSVNRKDKTDGLSQKAVDAYRKENPGSKLQTAVTEKKPEGKRADRRKSFCRRMKGMKSKLTSAETSRDPDSRINKALRRWNCN